MGFWIYILTYCLFGVFACVSDELPLERCVGLGLVCWMLTLFVVLIVVCSLCVDLLVYLLTLTFGFSS